MTTIELHNVSYHYPDGQPALKDIDLTLRSGNCYVLTGPNGCGKSSLFRILTGLSFPQSGTYTLDGVPITEKYLRDRANADAFHRRVGYLFQDTDAQLFTRSVEDEISFGLYQMGLPQEEINARTEQYLDRLSLSDLRARAPFNLSGGEKKRCALAAVLAMEPSVLIMDEPLSGLDEEGQDWITRTIRALKTPERLILIATHSGDLAASLADHTIVMDKTHRIQI